MMTRTHIVAFLVALAVSSFLTPIIRRIAHRFGLFDAPGDKRKIHTRPIPRLGGIGIALGFWAPLGGLLIYNNSISDTLFGDGHKIAAFFLGSVAILGVGVWDDIRGMRARTKLACQILISAAMVFLGGFVISRINIPFVGAMEFHYAVACAVTVFWFVAIMNAINLIDGLDGLAGGVAFFAVATLLAVTMMDAQVNILTTLFCTALAGAVVGFLFYNFNPATIFMGDGGSLFLGFVIASVGVHTQAKSSAALALTVCTLALGLPIIDTALSIFRRLKRGRDPFSADREHIHHRLLAMGLSPKQTALILYAFCAFLGIFAVALKMETEQNGSRQILVLLALGVILLAVSHLFRFRELIHQRRLALLLEEELALPADARVLVRRLVQGIRTTPQLSSVWEKITESGEILKVRDVEMRLYLRPEADSEVKQQYTLHRDEPQLSRLPIDKMTISLVGDPLWYGELRWTFRTAKGPDDAERRALMHLVTEAVVEHLEEHLGQADRERFVVQALTPAGERSDGGHG